MTRVKPEFVAIIAKVVPERRKTVIDHHLMTKCGDTMATTTMYRSGTLYSEYSLNKE